MRPDRELGQHFLVDDNVLGVIERLADLRPGDVVLEIGAGVGMLTARLAEPARTCTRSRSTGASSRRSRARWPAYGNVTRALGRRDAPRPRGLEPPADGVRGQPAVPRRGAARARLDRRSARRAALVRARAAGDRRAAHRRARDALYGGPSVLARSRSRRPAATPVSRSVFVPRAERRLDPGRVHAPAGVAGARRDWPASSRPCGRPSRTAARRSSTRSRWRAGARSRGGRGSLPRRRRRPQGARRGAAGRDLRRPGAGGRVDVLAGVKINSACASGRGGRTAITSSRPCSRPSARRLARARARRGDQGRGAGPPRRRCARHPRAAAARGPGGARRPAGGCRSRSATGGRRARRRQRRRRCRPAARERDAAGAARGRRPARARGGGRLGRPVLRLGRAAALARGRGELLEPCTLAAPAWVVLAWPGVELSTAEVYARYRPTGGAGCASRELSAAPFGAPAAAELAALVENDLAAPAEALCPPSAALRARLGQLGALTACVSGSGSAVFGLFGDEDAARAAHERARRRAAVGGRGPAAARRSLALGSSVSYKVGPEDVVVVDREGRRVPPAAPRGFHGKLRQRRVMLAAGLAALEILAVLTWGASTFTLVLFALLAVAAYYSSAVSCRRARSARAPGSWHSPRGCSRSSSSRSR